MATATIARDLPCIKCKYNLRGLEESGQCPECGSAIFATLSETKAEFHFRWTKRMAIVVGSLHLLLAAFLIITVLLTRTADGGVMLMVMDLPLWFPWRWFGGDTALVSDSAFIGFLIYCALAGTAMYAIVGAILGAAFDCLLWLSEGPSKP